MDDTLKTAIKRRSLIWEAMGESQYPKTRPLLTLEQFFLHSNGEADLWYNLPDAPKGQSQYDFHKAIRERANVWDVRISVTQLDEEPALTAETFESAWFEWPNSDHTLIVTTADEGEIRSWFPENAQPDEIDIGDRSGTEWGAPSFVPKGYHQVWLWYD